MVTPRMFSLMAISVGILVVSCAAPADQTAIPTQPAAQITAPTQPAAQSTGTTVAPVSRTPTVGVTKLNMDEIFPPGPGRGIVLDNCTTCHTFVPIVVLQMSQAQWDRNARDHRDRVRGLTDAEFKTIYEYLAASFNPDRPVPKLPKELLDTWTSY